MNAVIKVYCVHTEPNYSLPWQRKRQYSSTSSGFIVSGSAGQRWILTNAHSVEYHSQVCPWCFFCIVTCLVECFAVWLHVHLCI